MGSTKGLGGPVTITVDGPGGVSIDFPDGTDAAIIHGVMRQHFGGQQQSFGSHMAAAVTDIPGEIYGAGKSALSTINETFNPFSETAKAQQSLPPPKSFGESLGRQWDQFKQVGSGLAAVPALVASPITGTARSLIGHPYAAVTGMPYEQAKEATDTAMMALSPARGGLPLKGPAMPPKELAKVPAPTSAELKTAGGKQIEAAEAAATGDFQPEIMRALSDNTRQVLNPKRERIAPQAFGFVEDLAKDATVAEIRTTRELLGELRMGADPKERRAARIAIDQIDEFLTRNEPMAANILQEGNANYAAGKRVERLEQADAIAGLRTGRAGYGGNEVNARRQVISPIVEKYIKGNKAGFSADEMAALDSFVHGSRGINTLRTMAQMAPSKGGMSSFGGILPVVTGGTSLGIGAGAHKLAAVLTRSEFQGLIDKVAKRSPAYVEAVSKATDKYLAAAADFSAQPTPAKIAGLVTAARALSNGLKFDGINIGSGELLRRLQAPIPGAAEGDEPAVPGRPGE